MYISLNWINDYVDLSGIETEELVKRFNLATAEIEGYEVKGKNIQNVVFGKVLEVQNLRDGVQNAIIDASAACHMPDVLEMPYTPKIIGAAEIGVKKFNYRFGGATCLAGDIIGEYSFDAPLNEGDEIIFCDMAIYTMVKNNTFNGVKLPAIYAKNLNGTLTLIKNFGYEDFKCRLS